MLRNTAQSPSNTDSQRFLESEAYGRPLRVSITLRGVGVILPWTLALLTGTAQHSITFSNSSCVCASACLCSWKKVQVEGSSHIRVGCRALPISHRKWLTLGIFGDAQWLFWKPGRVTTEGSHRLLHRSMPPCYFSSHLCSCILPTAVATCGSTGTRSPPRHRVQVSVPTSPHSRNSSAGQVHLPQHP